MAGMKTLKKELEVLQRRRNELLKTVKIPADGLPGSLSSSRYRCGKANCHCRDGDGHEKWSLTYMQDGTKRVLHIPADLVEAVRQKVERGKSFKEAINEIYGANAQLLLLQRKEDKAR